jgi:hypothetical protein
MLAAGAALDMSAEHPAGWTSRAVAAMRGPVGTITEFAADLRSLPDQALPVGHSPAARSEVADPGDIPAVEVMLDRMHDSVLAAVDDELSTTIGTVAPACGVPPGGSGQDVPGHTPSGTDDPRTLAQRRAIDDRSC